MKKYLNLLIIFMLAFKCGQAQNSAIDTYTVQVTNNCSGCCTATLILNSIFNPCLAGYPVNFALITPTTTPPIYYNPITSWVNLCNGVYTVAANYYVNIPANCPTQFICSITYTPNPTYLNNIEAVSKYFNIYPNPSNDFINIEVQSVSNCYKKVSIYDQLGQMIKVEEIYFEKNLSKINTSELVNGVYYVSISDENGLSVKRVLVVSR